MPNRSINPAAAAGKRLPSNIDTPDFLSQDCRAVARASQRMEEIFAHWRALGFIGGDD
ncbi:MAG: hypothetical protein OXG85_00910 [Chloroflexi bacterium]|nr:hypothetical protein [Chloroflexota bacterium]